MQRIRRSILTVHRSPDKVSFPILKKYLGELKYGSLTASFLAQYVS